VLEAVFILLEFPSPSKRIFIGSHSLPPSLVPQGLDVFSPVVLGGEFQSPPSVISLGCFRDFSLGDLIGEICGNPSWFFGL
jgi:hypothetical protein